MLILSATCDETQAGVISRKKNRFNQLFLESTKNKNQFVAFIWKIYCAAQQIQLLKWLIT